MAVRFPRRLEPGDTVAVTSPSSGVEPRMQGRLDVALEVVRSRGYEVVVGRCMAGDRVVSAPREERAAELMEMLLDPRVAAVVPPWGGELAIDLVDLLDWEALERAEPTWVVGYSDSTTWMLPLTTRLGWATLHGHNLMDTPYRPPAGLLGWLDALKAPGPLTQQSPGRYRDEGWDDYVGRPGVDEMTLPGRGGWSVVGDPVARLRGRLVGGCLETVAHLAGTAYGDVAGWARAHAPEGTLVMLEAAEHGAYDVARALHGLRLAGWFEHANGVLVGRTRAPGVDGFSQHDAVRDALGGLGVPVVLDVEYGHTQPFMALLAGALAEVDLVTRRVTQTLA